MRLLLCAALLLTLPHLARPAPIPRERQDAGLYHPTRKGDRLVYDYRVANAESVDETLIVTAVEEKNQCKVVTIGCEQADKIVPRWTVSVSEHGLEVLSQKGKAFNPPDRLVRLPAKVGDKWSDESIQRTVGAIEKVEVPAGTFTAIQTECEWLVAEGALQKGTFWYAPEVGLVKMEVAEVTSVLKSFTPAGR
jgi:hypothetical protein